MTAYNLKEDNQTSAPLDGLIQVHKPDCQEFNELHEAIHHTTRITLSLLKAFPVPIPAEERITIFRCWEIISILKS